MTVEVYYEGFEVVDGGVEVEVGNPFPEVVRETTETGQILWLKSSPKKQELVSQEKIKPEKTVTK